MSQSLLEKPKLQSVKQRSKTKLFWNTKEHNLLSNALGYNTHNKFMRKYSERFFDLTEDADIAMTITPADQFTPVPDKINVLFTMWEFLDLPKTYIKGIAKADALIVPCNFCRDLFRRYTDKPIYVCWEGVDVNAYKHHQRTMPNISIGEKFRFLWVGAPNPRKGYPLVVEATKIIEQMPNVELYFKTTVSESSRWESLKAIWKNKKSFLPPFHKLDIVARKIKRIFKPGLADKLKVYGKHKNVIFDTRFLSFKDLIGLYNSAHCFLLPTFGEGWGLTLSEAMATGAPCIATQCTGTADFFDEQVGYTIKYEIKEQELQNYDLTARGYFPDTRDMVRHMMHVMQNYKEALGKGKKASSRILNKFTWERSALRLHEIIKTIKEGVGQDETEE